MAWRRVRAGSQRDLTTARFGRPVRMAATFPAFRMTELGVTFVGTDIPNQERTHLELLLQGFVAQFPDWALFRDCTRRHRTLVLHGLVQLLPHDWVLLFPHDCAWAPHFHSSILLLPHDCAWAPHFHGWARSRVRRNVPLVATVRRSMVRC